MKRPTHCRDCGQGPMIPAVDWSPGQLRYGARGLCHRDYARRRHAGTLIAFSRLTVPHKDAVAEYEELTIQGHSKARAAEIIGITLRALELALSRHKEKSNA